MPYLTGRVVDEAGILSPAARDRIEAVLATHESATTNQVAVLTVHSLGSDSVEGFAVKVFSTWKLGQKGKDNGVITPGAGWFLYFFLIPFWAMFLTAQGERKTPRRPDEHKPRSSPLATSRSQPRAQRGAPQ